MDFFVLGKILLKTVVVGLEEYCQVKIGDLVTKYC